MKNYPFELKDFFYLSTILLKENKKNRQELVSSGSFKGVYVHFLC